MKMFDRLNALIIAVKHCESAMEYFSIPIIGVDIKCSDLLCQLMTRKSICFIRKDCMYVALHRPVGVMGLLLQQCISQFKLPMICVLFPYLYIHTIFELLDQNDPHRLMT